MIPDKDAAEQLVDKAIELVKDNNRREILSKNIKQLEERDADLKIAKEVLKLVDEK